MDYDKKLAEMFKSLKIELVNFDNGSTPESMAAYILVSNLTKTMLKNKGDLVLDLGNYIYRKYNLLYEMCPEFHRSGEPKNSLAFYVSKRLMDKQLALQEAILNSYNKSHPAEALKRFESALYKQRRFIIYCPIQESV